MGFRFRVCFGDASETAILVDVNDILDGVGCYPLVMCYVAPSKSGEFRSYLPHGNRSLLDLDGY